ncbi:hypothetical protein SCLCIDRAFT_34830 [Scleroderma citrinum Foug A]|uniref:Uncharacterized protein n=1 Tax=Scleroderma citrinum Foug A TaxID=1036808 RepID=A0A0C3CMS0_9AGAM|nr:hypothetical protein SCLCIDRAFT_34830 [Scleroderma citrinum Foug A]
MQNIPYLALATLLPPTWIDAVHHALQNSNPFVNALLHYSVISTYYPNAELVLHDSGAAEIAAIMSYDNTMQAQEQIKPFQPLVTCGNHSHTLCFSLMGL